MASLFSKSKGGPKEKKQLMDLLAFIVTGTLSAAGGANVPANLAEKIEKLEPGLISPKSGATTDPAGNLLVYATSKGVAAIQGDNPAPAQPAAASTSQFVLETGHELPLSKRGGVKADVYPFKDMKVGQSFFVPATEDRPNPAKSMASTASSASKRYKANGLKFVVRARTTADGEKTNGARVYCIKAEAAPVQQAAA